MCWNGIELRFLKCRADLVFMERDWGSDARTIRKSPKERQGRISRIQGERELQRSWRDGSGGKLYVAFVLLWKRSHFLMVWLKHWLYPGTSRWAQDQVFLMATGISQNAKQNHSNYLHFQYKLQICTLSLSPCSHGQSNSHGCSWHQRHKALRNWHFPFPESE